MLLLSIVIYLILCAIVTINQRKMLYHPPILSSYEVDQLAQEAGFERWTNSAGEPMGLKRLSPIQPALGRVLVAYGNGGCTTRCTHYGDGIQSAASYDVYILEYPGYGDRRGAPSQTSLLQAANEAFQFLPTNAPIYLVGESLGSGVATYLAGTYPDKVAGVILISPYNKLADVAQAHMPIFPVHLLLFDRFPSEDYLRNYHGPVGMVVDGQDTVVPAKFGMRLYDGYTGPKRLWEFPSGGHIQVQEPREKFWKEVDDFCQTNRQSK